MELRKFTRLSMLLALSVVLNIVENMIPLFNGTVPGVKLGIANIVILFVLDQYGFRDAFFLSLTRVLLVSILYSGLFSVSFFLSLGGAVLSIVAMGIFIKITKLSTIGISVIGSLFHSLGQIIMVCFMIGEANAFFYLPIIILFAIPTGILTGVLTSELIKYFN